MAGFTIQLADLQTRGPMVLARLAISEESEAELRAAGFPVPAPIPIQAIIDTGAEISVVRQGLAQQLGLTPSGYQYVTTPSSARVAVPEYDVRIVLPSDIVIEASVIGAPLQARSAQCLIGRDVLANAVLVYLGPSNLFSLSF